jgi:hypothetical protein
MKRAINFLQSNVDRRTALAWLSAFILAALQAHFFLGGFRLTGDDVLFEDVILRGNIADYISQTAAQQARIGHYILIPLLLAGSHFSSILSFRVFYVLLWYIDILLFSVWLGRLSHSRITLLVFIGIVVLQSMIGYHMPPVGYPLQLGVPLLIILGTRLLMVTDHPSDPASLRFAPRILRYSGWLLYAAAVLSCEYMMIFGTVIVLMEATASAIDASTLDPRNRLSRYRLDIGILALAYAVYTIYRISQPSRYDGATMNGLNNYRDLLFTFFMHVASGTWIPFVKSSAPTRGALPGALLSMALCIISLMLYPRSENKKPIRSVRSWLLLSGLLLLGITALTLPVVAAVKQQQWCMNDHNCSYLDSRLSLLMLVGATMLATLSLSHSSASFRLLRATAFATLTVSAGACYAIGWQQAQGMRIASSAWTRARMIACNKPSVDAASASNFIDSDRYIPMHPIMDRDAFWQAYMNRIAKDDDCIAQVPVAKTYPSDELVVGAIAQVRLGGSGLPFLAAGWSHPEQGGVWSIGSPAIFDVPLAPNSKPLIMALQLTAYGPAPGQPQSVMVSVDGVPVAQWNVDSEAPKIYSFAIPLTLSRTGGHVHVRLDIAHPTSPLQRQESTDPRELGVLLSNLQAQTSPLATAPSTTR